MERWSLPEGWTNATLDSQLIAVTSGFAYPKSRLALSGFAHLRPFNIGGNGELDLSTIYYIPNNVVSNINDYSLEPGDILFNNTNSVELVGKSAIVRKPLLCTFSNHITRIRVVDRERLDPGWLLLCLRNLWMEGFFAKKCNRWIGQAGFNNSKLAEVIIPLPPLETQRWIVARLDALLAEVAAARRLHAEIAEDTARVMEAAIQEVFDQPVNGWQTRQLSDVAFIQTGTAKGRDFRRRKTIELPYLRVANVQAGYLDLSEIKTIHIAEDEVDRYRLQIGDLLLTEGGDFDKLGRGAVWRGEIEPCVHQNHIFAVRLDPTCVQPEFAEYEMLSWHAKRYFLGVAKKTTNLATINRSQLAAFPIRFPDLSEQMRIVTHLNAMKQQVAELEEMQRQEQDLLAEVEQTILSHAFRGEL